MSPHGGPIALPLLELAPLELEPLELALLDELAPPVVLDEACVTFEEHPAKIPSNRSHAADRMAACFASRGPAHFHLRFERMR